jgi:ABC-type sugar transport system permease subunit
LAPQLLLFGVFLLLPLVLTLVLGLQDSSGFGAREWVGLENYRTMAGDDVFWRALVNTIVFSAITVPASLGLGLGLALLLNRPIAGRTAFRAIFYLPYVLSGVVIAITSRWIFNENIGVVNKILRALGGDGVSWQSAGVPAFVSVMIVLCWARMGFVMVIYLAGLQGVPREYYEAAKVDGATRWQQFRAVTWPGLRPTTFFLVVMLVIECFQVFDIVYVMTGGGPGNSTELLNTYAYTTGFEARRQGYAAAIGVVIYALVLLFTVLWWRAQRNQEADA